MSYEKQTWVDEEQEVANLYEVVDRQDGTQIIIPAGITKEGTPITAQRMNHMEFGIKKADDHAYNPKAHDVLFNENNVDNYIGRKIEIENMPLNGECTVVLSISSPAFAFESYNILTQSCSQEPETWNGLNVTHGDDGSISFIGTYNGETDTYTITNPSLIEPQMHSEGGSYFPYLLYLDSGVQCNLYAYGDGDGASAVNIAIEIASGTVQETPATSPLVFDGGGAPLETCYLKPVSLIEGNNYNFTIRPQLTVGSEVKGYVKAELPILREALPENTLITLPLPSSIFFYTYYVDATLSIKHTGRVIEELNKHNSSDDAHKELFNKKADIPDCYKVIDQTIVVETAEEVKDVELDNGAVAHYVLPFHFMSLGRNIIAPKEMPLNLRDMMIYAEFPKQASGAASQTVDGQIYCRGSGSSGYTGALNCYMNGAIDANNPHYYTARCELDIRGYRTEIYKMMTTQKGLNQNGTRNYFHNEDFYANPESWAVVVGVYFYTGSSDAEDIVFPVGSKITVYGVV